MGLLDNLDDPQRQALLMMAAGLLSPVQGRGGAGFAQALSRAIPMGVAGYTTAARTQEATKRGEMERKLHEGQLADAERARQFRQAIKFTPGGPIPYNDTLGSEPPQGPVGMRPEGLDLSEAEKIDPFAAYQLKQGMKKQNTMVTKGAKVFGPDGNLLYDNSEPVKPDKPKYVPGDTRVIESGRVKITQEFQPDGTWKNSYTSAIDKPEGPEKGPAAPQGYQWNGARLEPIPGGPADAKVGKEADAANKRTQGALERADFILKKVNESVAMTGKNTAGALGVFMRQFPGTEARSLQRALDPIKANIGFAELQAMREASPTGGALGQVAVQELNMLQSVLGSLEQDQSPEELLKTLYSIDKHFNGWKRAVQQSKQQAPEQQAPSRGFRVIGVER